MTLLFLELYNEEITDLLAPEDISRSLEDRQQRKPLALMEDGKGGVLVRGLEEEVVYSANEIYNLLERGSAKRRTAETFLNKQSSRSHSIFSITIHIKEATPEGEELMKCGKLNLVDLAGSENISRSGARDGRAREAGEINKSLLTLGRVITALVEHLGHIPYRDSKLTRLLRDSLGGKTKTCIIATVSPSVHCLEETLSTLDYAHRAKNIKNKPEVNQKMMKSMLIKDLYSEMEKLKAEVNAAREKNGVYLPREHYLQEEAEKKAMSERIDQMEFDIEVENKRLDALQDALDSERHQCEDLNTKFENSQRKLQQTQEALVDAKDKIKQAQYTIKERDFIISKFQQSEDALVKQAGILQSQLENCITDVTGLHLKIDRKSKVETDNHHTLQTFQGDLGQQLKALEGSVTASIEQQQQHLQHMQGQVESLMASKNKVVEALRQNAMSVKEIYFSGLRGIHDLLHSHEKDSTSTFQKVNLTISVHSTALQELLSASVSEAETLFQDLQNAFIRQQDVISSLICQQQEKVQQSVDAAKQISKKLVAFYLLQEQSATEISGSVLDSHKNLYQTLMDLKEAYEELSKQEEQTLIERIAEMVAAASARKSEIVNSKVSVLRESIITNSDCLQHDVHRMCEARTESQSQWQVYIKEAENHFNQVSASFASSQSCLEDAVGHCIKRTTEAGEGWKKAQLSVRQLEKNNHLAVDLIIKEGVYGNGRLLSNFEEMNDSVESDVQLGNSILMESIDGCLQVDVDATTAMLTTVATQTQTLTELQVCHSMETCDIQSQADLCFNNEYLEDKPTGLTPMKRPIHLTNKALIEALRVPGIEKLVQEFRDVTHLSSPEKDAAATQRDMAVKESKIPIFAESSLLKDNRAPLTAVN